MSKTTHLRRRILDCARHQLVDEGFGEFSMRKIAQKVGCSATSIYLYFEDKDRLLHALIEEGFDQLQERLEEVVSKEQKPVPKIAALLHAYIEFGLQRPEYYEVMFMLQARHMLRYPPDKFRKARQGIDLIADLLNMAKQEGTIDIEDCTISAWSMWSAMHGAISLMLARRLDVKVDPSRYIKTTIELALNAILVDKERSKLVYSIADDAISRPEIDVAISPS